VYEDEVFVLVFTGKKRKRKGDKMPFTGMKICNFKDYLYLWSLKTNLGICP